MISSTVFQYHGILKLYSGRKEFMKMALIVVALGINPIDIDFHGGGGQCGSRGPSLFLKLSGSISRTSVVSVSLTTVVLELKDL